MSSYTRFITFLEKQNLILANKADPHIHLPGCLGDTRKLEMTPLHRQIYIKDAKNSIQITNGRSPLPLLNSLISTPLSSYLCFFSIFLLSITFFLLQLLLPALTQLLSPGASQATAYSFLSNWKSFEVHDFLLPWLLAEENWTSLLSPAALLSGFSVVTENFLACSESCNRTKSSYSLLITEYL